MTLYKRKKLGMLKMLNIIILELLDKKKLMEIFKTLEQKPSKIELYLIEKNIKGVKVEELNTNEGNFKYYLS